MRFPGKISCIFSEFDKILPQNNIFCSVFTNILLGAVRKKYQKRFDIIITSA